MNDLSLTSATPDTPAARLAGVYSKGSDLFLLDMGEPVKIMDLAHRMIELSGRSVQSKDNPDGDISIRITGPRLGKKLYEELLIDHESLTDTPYEKITRARVEAIPEHQVVAMLNTIAEGVASRNPAVIRTAKKQYVAGYHDPKPQVIGEIAEPAAAPPAPSKDI